MKKIILPIFILSFAGVIFLISCQKPKTPCEGCRGNKPPISVAGPDQVITLPTDSVSLDGNASSDPDGTISEWHWTKISGPASFSINSASLIKTVVKNLLEGSYLFELKVTDAGGLFSKDTVQVTVNSISITGSCEPFNRPIVNAQLIPVGNLSIGRYFMATISAGNKIFFAGGVSAPNTRSSRVDIFDITSQSWSTAELSIPRGYLSAVAAGDKVFFAGGYAIGASSRVDIYDLITQTWSIAELSEARAYIETAAVGNKVFFAGGSNGSSYSSRVDIYDISANTWSTANLSEAKIGFTVTEADNKIYFAGGEPQGGAVGYASIKIDIYNNATDSWSSSVLNAPKKYHGAIFKNGKIYWAGGITYTSPAAGNEDSVTCQVEIKDVNTQVSSFANLYNPTLWNKAFEIDNKIVFITTYTGWANWYHFDIYDLASGSWSIGVSPQLISSYASCISINNTIYIAGGIVNNVPSNKVWKLEF
jgi:N-acetylneuraminic acid mutarotase